MAVSFFLEIIQFIFIFVSNLTHFFAIILKKWINNVLLLLSLYSFFQLAIYFSPVFITISLDIRQTTAKRRNRKINLGKKICIFLPQKQKIQKFLQQI